MKRLSNASRRLKGQAMFQILAQTKELEKKGMDIIHFELGEPDAKTPDNIVNACIQSLRNGETHYVPSSGIEDIKQAACRVTLKSRNFLLCK